LFFSIIDFFFGEFECIPFIESHVTRVNISILILVSWFFYLFVLMLFLFYLLNLYC